MPIVPDEKDWTWVLDRVCPECGFDTAAVDRDELPGRIAATSRAWEEVLGRPDVRQRPGRGDLVAARVRAATCVTCTASTRAASAGCSTRIDPYYDNWDQDATAVEDRYAEQDPAVVAGELTAAGTELASLFAGVSGDGWSRTGRRSDGASFTVDSIGRYYLHDIEHHLWDVS